MLDPHDLIEIADDIPEMGRPVLIHAFTGFVDAGSCTRLIHDHLTSNLTWRPVARFDLDQLFDYRSRRPGMIFASSHWEHYEAPRLEVLAMHDRRETPFLFLTGPEPDLAWERFVAGAIVLAEHFSARLSIGLNTVPMAAPHTRPCGMTALASRPELLPHHSAGQRLELPGSAGALLQYRMAERGHDALGFAAHVPHYLAQSDYPPAAARLLAGVQESTGLDLYPEPLLHAGELVLAEVDRQVTRSQDAQTLVDRLEQQYDRWAAARQAGNEDNHLPTADELAAELERFLADQGKSGGDQSNT